MAQQSASRKSLHVQSIQVFMHVPGFIQSCLSCLNEILLSTCCLHIRALAAFPGFLCRRTILFITVILGMPGAQKKDGDLTILWNMPSGYLLSTKLPPHTVSSPLKLPRCHVQSPNPWCTWRSWAHFGFGNINASLRGTMYSTDTKHLLYFTKQAVYVITNQSTTGV